MLTDVLVILLAFSMALVVRAVVFDKIPRYYNAPLEISSVSMGVLYLGWFILAVVLVAHQCGLYSGATLEWRPRTQAHGSGFARRRTAIVRQSLFNP
jgi:hypothetical protein